MLKKILIGIFYAFLIFLFFIALDTFYLQNQRAKRAFSKEKEKLLVNWNKHEEEIRSIKNMVVEIEIIKEILPWTTDTLRIEIANCIEKSQEDFFEYITANISNPKEISDSLFEVAHRKFWAELDCTLVISKSKVVENFMSDLI